jgi:hypothetical protein
MKIIEVAQFLAAQVGQRPFQSPTELGMLAIGLLVGMARDWLSRLASPPAPMGQLVPVTVRRRAALANGLRGYVDPFARSRYQR